MTFLAPIDPASRCCAGCGRTSRADGRAAIGFGAGRGYEFDDFLADAAAAGWAADLLLSTWDLRPFTPDAEFLVAVLRPA